MVSNILSHPYRAAGATKALSRKIAAHRAKGIADLQRTIESLTHLASEPGFDFAGKFIRECEAVLVELEALDPDDPPSFEKVMALAGRLENILAEILRRMIDAVGASP